MDTYVGRKVSLGIFSEPANANKLEHAMYSIKESMKWDEDTFNLECDLGIHAYEYIYIRLYYSQLMIVTIISPIQFEHIFLVY